MGKAGVSFKGLRDRQGGYPSYIKTGVRVVGTDAWSWDAPFSRTGIKWKESLIKGQPDSSIIWEGHFAGIEIGYCQMEKLTNLDRVPPRVLPFTAFP
jgi:hypothetical protein